MEQFLINKPINSELINEELNILEKEHNSGSKIFFLGTVRADKINGKTVKTIEYSAYNEMAEFEFGKIKDQILNQYPDVNKIVIYHSIGKVNTGENSLYVLVSSGHRKQGFEAISEIVDLIKAKVPIWKKEIFVDDTYVWTE